MIPIDQAVRASTVLAAMTQRVAHAQRLLRLVQPHLPPPLRAQVWAGPLDDGTWCLLAANSAVASKLRLLSPTLLAALQAAGEPTLKLRIKVRPAPAS